MTDAVVVTSDPTPPPAAPDFGALAGDAYSHAKQEFISKNGEAAWREIMEGKAPAAPLTEKAPEQPTATNGKTVEPAKAAEGDDVEPGEITINADGKAIDKATGRFVPHSAYKRVQSEAKEAKQQASELMRRVVQTQERLATLLEPQPEPAKKAEPEPVLDPEKDIFGAFRQLAKRYEVLENRLKEATSTTAQKLENTDLRERFVSDAQRFTAKEPAFAAAYQYVIDSMNKELEAEGFADATERTKMIAENIRDRATRLLRANKSPAETIWAIAQTRGFKPTPPNDPAKEKEAQAKAELDRINKTKGATMTLNGAGTAGTTEGLTLQKLASLTGEDYSSARRAYIGKYGESAWRQLIGG